MHVIHVMCMCSQRARAHTRARTHNTHTHTHTNTRARARARTHIHAAETHRSQLTTASHNTAKKSACTAASSTHIPRFESLLAPPLHAHAPARALLSKPMQHEAVLRAPARSSMRARRSLPRAPHLPFLSLPIPLLSSLPLHTASPLLAPESKPYYLNPTRSLKITAEPQTLTPNPRP